MIKVVFFCAVLISLIISYLIYLQYENKGLVEEELGFSANFKNITRVYDAKMILNFNSQEMMFSSNLKPIGDGIMLNLGSKGFVKNPQSCDDTLLITSKNGSKFSRTFHYDQIFPLKDYSPVDVMELMQSCEFQQDLVPNGSFTMQFFNQTQERSLIVDDITFTSILNDKKYGCRETCVFTKQLIFYDSNPVNSTRTVIFNGKNINETTIDLSLRTYNKDFQLIADTSKALFTGLIMASLGIGYDLLKNKPKKSIKWKNEIKFFVIAYLSNGFTITSIIITLTRMFKDAPPVHEFRTSLWYDQAFFVILIPLIAQMIFRVSKKPEINPAVKRILNKHVLISIVVSFSTSFAIISYAFFAGSIMLIIPIDNPITRNPNIDFSEFTFWFGLCGYIASIISLIITRSKKYFKDNGDLTESDWKIFSLENKIVTMSILVSMSMVIFFIIYHAH